jgi:hypothetical protein
VCLNITIFFLFVDLLKIPIPMSLSTNLFYREKFFICLMLMGSFTPFDCFFTDGSFQCDICHQIHHKKGILPQGCLLNLKGKINVKLYWITKYLSLPFVLSYEYFIQVFPRLRSKTWQSSNCKRIRLVPNKKGNFLTYIHSCGLSAVNIPWTMKRWTARMLWVLFILVSRVLKSLKILAL